MPEPPDWRSPEAEHALSRLERQEFAWEFLRRNPEYRRDYHRLSRDARSLPGRQQHESNAAQQWGLRFPAGPEPAGWRGGNPLAARGLP